MTALLAFDLMGTLLTDPYREAHEAATGLPMAELVGIGLADEYHRLERGELTERGYWQYLRNRGVRVDIDTFHRVRLAGYRWLPGMRELLAECVLARCRTIIASNYPLWIDQIRADLFAGVGVGWYPSCRCGVRKPSTRYFAGLCASFGTGIEHLLLIDDKPRNTDAVRKMGGRAINFDSAADTRVRLADVVPALVA